ncbi:MAG: hypothetical protein LBD75_03115 [Candidatus Peribacteria bacterium]|jgi:hypothetical protein|nr:hypothetical protein [Candidatus Peribacteria bacterium]
MDTPQGEALLNTSPEIQTFMEKINLFTEIPGEGEAISRADATKLFMQYFSTIQKES